jgi:hypothetical protein
MWPRLATVIIGMSLFVALPALATVKREPGGRDGCPLPPAVKILKGKLKLYLPGQIHPITASASVCLDRGGEIYCVDFATPELLLRAKSLNGKSVVLTGRTEMRENSLGDVKSPVFVVSGIQSAEGMEESIKVEIQGKLQCLLVHWETGQVYRVLDGWSDEGGKSYPPVPGIAIDGRMYRLRSDPDRLISTIPLSRLHELCGRRVIVTGTLEGDTVTVRSLCADGEYIKKTSTLRIQGKLEANTRLMGCPRRGYSIATINGRTCVLDVAVEVGLGSFAKIVTAKGGTYVLDFATRELAERARQLDGQSVIVTGTLSGVRPVPILCMRSSGSQPTELPVLRVTHLAPEALPYPFNLPSRGN